MEDLIDFFGPELMVIIISMLPILELRAGIPLGISFGLSPAKAFLLGVFGNLLVVPILLYILKPVIAYLERKAWFKGFIVYIKKRTLRKSKDLIKKYRVLGLFILVALPVPTTGAYTGCLAASLLKISYKKALLAIIAGVCVAGFIVSGITFQFI